MARTDGFDDVFAALRRVLVRHASRRGFVGVETAGKYQLSSTTRTDRVGRPLFVAAVQINRHYVSYHLMPIYMDPTLQTKVSPALRRRMQGKACFNFTTIEKEQLAELATLTALGIRRFRDIALPWHEDRSDRSGRSDRSRSLTMDADRDDQPGGRK